MHLGILGGTFDPPHLAHLALAEQACTQLKLAQVLFCPAGQQPLKTKRAISAVHHRLAMVELAIAGNPRFSLSRVDIDRPGPHYTADMLALLRASFPDHVLYFLMGADALRDIPHWREPASILAQAYLAVAARPGATPDLSALEARLPELPARLIWLNAPQLNISSTDIRQRRRNGQSIHGLTPAAVEAYIYQHKLYQT